MCSGMSYYFRGTLFKCTTLNALRTITPLSHMVNYFICRCKVIPIWKIKQPMKHGKNVFYLRKRFEASTRKIQIKIKRDEGVDLVIFERSSTIKI